MPRHLIRFILILLGIVSLLSAMWGGLVRLGWSMPVLQPALATFHGPLMVSGFLGTLISLERATRMEYRWTYAVPALTGFGALILMTGSSSLIGESLITLGSFGLFITFIVIMRIQLTLANVVMGVGALLWLIGNIFWMTDSPIYRIVFWWAGFLVLIIAGERLAIIRILSLSKSTKATFLVALGIFLLGLVLTSVNYDNGIRLLGAGMISLMILLIRYDIAWRSVRGTGLSRFIAICLLTGYIWLGISGAIALSMGSVPLGLTYDAVLHALFLGFVFSMIFGHAPVIFSGVLGIPVSYQPQFYAHLVFLHLTLIMRVVGDLCGWSFGRQLGGLLNVFVLLVFLANTVYAIRTSFSKTKSAQ
ncbi:MAG TPA: hypothetical protein VGA95_04795 [Thermodesulfobacteriota bacterium]